MNQSGMSKGKVLKIQLFCAYQVIFWGMFNEEYLEYENIKSLCVKDFEE